MDQIEWITVCIIVSSPHVNIFIQGDIWVPGAGPIIG